MDRSGSEAAGSAGLGPRLAAIAARVPRGSRVADVGADHGRLAEHLLCSGRAAACIATEARPHRLDALRTRISGPTAPRGLELRIGDGLTPLDPTDRIDVIVLAGLGGDTIRRILDRPALGRLAPARVLVQPQTRHRDVRAFLRHAGYRLVDECVVREDGRTYVVLAAEPGPETAYAASGGDLDDDALLHAGPLLVARRDPTARDAWTDEVTRLEAVVAGLPACGGRRARDDLARARRIVEALRRPTG